MTSIAHYSCCRFTEFKEVTYEGDYEGVVPPRGHHTLIITDFTKHLGTLSGGQKRKLSLALALVSNPSVLLLDEPLAGMDPENRALVCRL